MNGVARCRCIFVDSIYQRLTPPVVVVLAVTAMLIICMADNRKHELRLFLSILSIGSGGWIVQEEDKECSSSTLSHTSLLL